MDNPFVLIFIVIIIGGIFINFYFSKKAKIKRKLKKSSFKSLRNFKDNEVAKIVGNVVFVDKPLIAPLSKRECSFYYILIEEQVSSGKNRRWKTILEEEVSSKFLIKEDDKYAFINDTNLECYIVQDKSYSSGFLNDASENLKQFLKSKGFESEGFLGMNKTLRYKEGILEKDEEIAVFGKGKWINASTIELPDNYNKVLEITPPDNDLIFLSDDPKTTLKEVMIQKKSNYNKKEESYIKRY